MRFLVFLTLAAMAALTGLSACTPKECPKKGWVSDRCAPVGEFPYGKDNRLYIPNSGENVYRWRGGISYDKESKVVSSPLLAFDRSTLQPLQNPENRYPLGLGIPTAVSFNVHAPLGATAEPILDPTSFAAKHHAPSKGQPVIPAPSGFAYWQSSDPSTDEYITYLSFLRLPAEGASGQILSCSWVHKRIDGRPVDKVESCRLSYNRQDGIRVDASFRVVDQERIPDEETYQALNALIDRWKSPAVAARPRSR